MGIKRKSSVLEDFEVSISQQQSHFASPTTPPSTSSLSSPLSSTSTTASEDEHGHVSTPAPYTFSRHAHTPTPSIFSNHAHSPTPSTFWNLERVRIPYLNSRTRKRHRDGRPDEETVHETTLKKLYDAQRLHLDEAMHIPEEMIMSDGQHQDTDAEMLLDDDDNQEAVPPVEIPRMAQRNQSTIDAFFNRKDGTFGGGGGQRVATATGT